MIEELNLDHRDIKILSWFMEDPHVSQSEIATRLKLSQPSVNFRIHKLKQRGMLNFQTGLSLNKTGLFMARIDFTAKNAPEVLKQIKQCEFFVNGFTMSGKRNVSVQLVNTDLKKIDEIVNLHIRSRDDINNIDVQVIVNAANDFLFSVNLDKEGHEHCYKVGGCKDCRKPWKYQKKKN